MKYHLIGVGGVSMRGIKKYLEYLGHTVTGSDLKTGGHKKENITSDIDLVVRTSAVNPGSPGWVEVEEANEKSIKVIKRADLLAELFRDKKLIAISGMHGKTTTTTMVGKVLIEAGFDPTVLVGDEVPEFDNDVIRIGQSDWVVFEACEYDKNILSYNPKYLILTNIEEEHLDSYPGGLQEIKETFVKYIQKVPEDGVIIACADDQNVIDVINDSQTKTKVIYYGEKSEKYKSLDFELSIPGHHNILNALAALALADFLQIDQSVVQKALKNFKNAKRRFELLGNYKGADLIDDYGHHPTEIKATIQALIEKYPDKKKIVVFWPHQYKRILPLIDDFGRAFTGADEVIIKPIFFVPGRDEVLNVSSKDLVGKINQSKNNAKYFETDEEIVEYLKDNLDENSVLLTIGIPPVYKISEKILESK